MIRFFILALTLSSLATSHAVDLKFGVVDMSKAFSEYFKTKEAAEKFKGNLDKAQKEMNDRWSVYKNLMTEMKKLKKEASDPIMNQDARKKKAVSLKRKLKSCAPSSRKSAKPRIAAAASSSRKT